MHLEKLQLVNFRNYEDARFEFSDKLNSIVGRNGRGKTNLLDAVYYLCMCKSHFTPNDRPVLRRGGEFIRLVGTYRREERQDTVVAKVVPGKRKDFERNGRLHARLMDHIGLYPIVFITPDDTQLAREGSEERRRFVDNTLCQTDPTYLRNLVDFNKLLRQRNALLRQYSETGHYSRELLDTYDRQMVEPVGYIHQHRERFVETFSPVFTEFYQRISGGHEPVELVYQTKLGDAPLPALLEPVLERELRLGRTLVGPHRDDLGFRLNGFPVKRFASQGQLKSFVLALKLAQYDHLRTSHNLTPILLLDDIFDKLDTQRVAQLLELLTEQQFGQIFLTDTDPERVARVTEQLQVEKRVIAIE